MIYFDEEKQAYNSQKTIQNWGKTCIFSCSDEMYDDFISGKYIWENNVLVLNPDYNNIKLNKAKEIKITENDSARDTALNRGVVYKNVLFDSDTDQKANLTGAILQMNDTGTVEWFGMNNDSLVCTKEDLLNIGGLITELHSFCWNKNAEIKTAINEAITTEQLEGVNIDYEV